MIQNKCIQFSKIQNVVLIIKYKLYISQTNNDISLLFLEFK